MKKEKLLAITLPLLFILLHFYGINWGVQSKELSFLVFGNNEILRKLIPEMLKTHEEIREMQVYYGAPYTSDYREDEIKKVEINGKKKIKKDIINSCRSYLTRSSGADEQAVIVALSKMNPQKFNFAPHFYEYGGGYLYPMGLFFYLLSKIKLITLTSDMSFYFLNPDEMGKLYISGRIFGAIGALLSIVVFYFLCRELFTDKKLVYFLTLFYGTAPGFVLWSHYLKPFSYGLLWFLLTLWAVVRFYKSNREKYLYLSAVSAGLSFGTLLTYGYIYLAIFLFILFSVKDYKWKLKNLFLTLIIFLATFFITNPYVLISYKEFIQELAYLRNYWHRDISINAVKVFVFNTMRYGLGTPLWFTLLIGLVGSLVYKPEKINWLFFLVFVPAFFYFAFTTVHWVHYSIFLYPLLIISAGLSISRVGQKKMVVLLLSGIVIYTFLYTSSYVKILGGRNIRIAAGEWINENIPSGSKIGLLEAPSPWRTPPFQFLDYKLIISQERNIIEKEKPEYFIVSEYQWLRGPGYNAIKDFLYDYEVIQRFEKEPYFFGIRFKQPDDIPYDWCHPNPVILIWKRKT